MQRQGMSEVAWRGYKGVVSVSDDKRDYQRLGMVMWISGKTKGAVLLRADTSEKLGLLFAYSPCTRTTVGYPMGNMGKVTVV
jgi:hypothetical protein